MNAMVLDASNTVANWTINFLSRANRTFTWIGYTRAGNELRRMGYHDEADRLFAERSKL